jgi:hypothetical protein
VTKYLACLEHHRDVILAVLFKYKSIMTHQAFSLLIPCQQIVRNDSYRPQHSNSYVASRPNNADSHGC